MVRADVDVAKVTARALVGLGIARLTAARGPVTIGASRVAIAVSAFRILP
jgi:hypothetical protein